MRCIQLLAWGAIAALSAGCATRARLTVVTEPPGGYVSEQGGGLVAGTAPAVIAYDPASLAQFKDAAGCYLVRGVESRWVSGAVSRSEPSIRLCGSATGNYTYRLVRDPAFPDLYRDLQFAAQLSSVAAQNAQASAASTAAAAALLQAARPSTSQPPASALGFLKREYTSGFNRICVYDRLGSEFVVTIASTALCPLNAP